MTWRGSRAFWQTSARILVSGAISLCLVRGSALNILLRSELHKQEMGSCKAASCLQPYSASWLTLLTLSWRVQIAPCLLTVFIVCIWGKSLKSLNSHSERAVQLCINSIQDWVPENGFKFSVSSIDFSRTQTSFLEICLSSDKRG